MALAMVFAAGLSSLDFASLVVLYPVFSALAGGEDSGGSNTSSLWLVGGMEPGTLILVAMAIMIGRSVLGFLMRMWWGYRAAQAEVALGSRLVRTYAFAPYAFHLSNSSSELLGRAVSHVNMATTIGLGGIVLLAGDLTAALAMTGALFFVNPVAALAIGLYLGLMGGFFLFFSRTFVKRQSDALSKRIGHVYAHAAHVLRGIRELTVSNGREVALAEMDEARSDMTIRQRNLIVLSEVPRMVLEVGLYAAILLSLLWVLGKDAQETVLPIVALYVVAALRILPALARLLGTVTQIRTGFELGEQLGREIEQVEAQGHQVNRPAGDLPPEGDLRLDHLTFAYDAEQPVLDGLDLIVQHGETVGIVGSSGSGKTTLLGILLGLLAPTAGHVRYGGADIGVADPRWLSMVAYVPQDVFIVDDTVLANVCLGDSRLDESRAYEALTSARLADVIDGLPEGMHTRVHEGGARLSVGQRQRLGIARALYRNAQVLLLDEPTAALDSTTEAEVVETLNALRGEVTMIVVAHRLGTLDAADRVLQLEGGALVRIR
ncbi:ABC transporter ATP-binding protein [Nocardioides sp.]|uniref:ABC transporter ATP-binding protein n=1 Tax=Nocardioides sp. TaxID=35761 RepID=UPI0035637D26